jgi:hypothetical protein
LTPHAPRFRFRPCGTASAGDAGAPAEEIEITPEMVEEVACGLLRFSREEDEDRVAREILRKVFRLYKEQQ